MLLHFARNVGAFGGSSNPTDPFRPIVACAACKTYDFSTSARNRALSSGFALDFNLQRIRAPLLRFDCRWCHKVFGVGQRHARRGSLTFPLCQLVGANVT